MKQMLKYTHKEEEGQKTSKKKTDFEVTTRYNADKQKMSLVWLAF
jgi:hypothetical protein